LRRDSVCCKDLQQIRLIGKQWAATSCSLESPGDVLQLTANQRSGNFLWKSAVGQQLEYSLSTNLLLEKCWTFHCLNLYWNKPVTEKN